MLSLFFKDEDGRKNAQSLSNGTITSMVQQVITYYWRIAGYETVSKPPEPIQTSSSHDDDSDDIFSDDENKENKDKDFVVPIKCRKKGPDRINVSVPRNLVSQALTGSLDRTKTSSRSAMRNLSALVSTFQTPDGDKVGMDSFVHSRDSIDRRRQNERQVISLQAKLEFLENLPEHLVCHWDGKMIEDLLGILNEAEAIVASGGNGKYKDRPKRKENLHG